MFELEFELEPMPGHLPLGMPEVPVGGLAAAAGVPAVVDGELVLLLLAELDVEVDAADPELEVVELELGAAVPELSAAKATEVPTPTRAPLNSTAAISCLVLLFIVRSSFLLVRWDTAMLRLPRGPEL
ncbi:MAG TPA: hypothetical protein VKX24_06300 [Acidimicrobiia bacterium]|nr:hypothetical protein [Acidimicrobiia bacterium]